MDVAGGAGWVFDPTPAKRSQATQGDREHGQGQAAAIRQWCPNCAVCAGVAGPLGTVE